MDHQPLNTGEQKDMAEFFIDLVSKLEEMTPELKKLVKTLFGGVISNNVVSLVSHSLLRISNYFILFFFFEFDFVNIEFFVIFRTAITLVERSKNFTR